jgi:hypothetical protein
MFFSKPCIVKNNSKADVTLFTNHFVLRMILIEIACIFSIVSKAHALWGSIIVNKFSSSSNSGADGR